jgi:hypothetical protein
MMWLPSIAVVQQRKHGNPPAGLWSYSQKKKRVERKKRLGLLFAEKQAANTAPRQATARL